VVWGGFMQLVDVLPGIGSCVDQTGFGWIYATVGCGVGVGKRITHKRISKRRNAGFTYPFSGVQ